MQNENCAKLIKGFRVKYALDGEDENIVVTMHLMNTHLIDVTAAQDHSSRSGDDHGIDGWHFDKNSGELFIYQSKISPVKSMVVLGMNDLLEAKNWLEKVLIEGALDKNPTNHCLYNLYMELINNKDAIKKINFILISLFNSNELEDKPEYNDLKNELINSKLKQFLLQNGGRIDLRLEEYNFDTALPNTIMTYPIAKIENSTVILRKNSYLNLAYIPLHSLVELYRRRGDILFDKNIRLSIMGSKEAKERLVNPLENTLDLICSGKLSANIFPFYHVGVTIAATTNETTENDMLELVAPSIINGCQTITIADHYLKNLEDNKKINEINKFKDIKVIAKVVIGTTDEELKEITNSNNRQIPIENWQLFCNEPIHIEIDLALKDLGIFYERQKGKFSATIKRPDMFKPYIHTNNTYIDVVVLGQMICLSRKDLQKAAKPSEIFLNKSNHDAVFDRCITKYGKDIVLIFNLFKAIKRALFTYLEKPVHSDDNTFKIFDKPIIKTYMYYVALLYFYQAKEKLSIRQQYCSDLHKKASQFLVDQFESFYSRVISKTKKWYMEESRQLQNDVSARQRDKFLNNLCIELGIDLDEGDIPFTERAIKWSEYENRYEQ